MAPRHPEAPTGDGPAKTSYYLREIHKGALNVDRMMPSLFSPKPKEIFHQPPMRTCNLVSGDGTYNSIAPQLEALRAFDFPETGAEPLVLDVLGKLKEARTALEAALQQPVSDHPVRILTKHYPREDLPGRCFTVHIAFFTVPDPFFDGGGDLATVLQKVDGKSVPGLLLEARHTYQTKDLDAPRLIEAMLETHPEVVGRTQRLGFAQQSEVKGIHAFAQDPFIGGHFQLYGGGKRWGLAWFDRSLGLADPDPWSAAYTTMREGKGISHLVRIATPPPELVIAFLKVVQSA